MNHLPGSAYCYYHNKLQTGAITTIVNEHGNELPARIVYPVWPLPVGGYVLLEVEKAA